jgi:hypothetical protein
VSPFYVMPLDAKDLAGAIEEIDAAYCPSSGDERYEPAHWVQRVKIAPPVEGA